MARIILNLRKILFGIGLLTIVSLPTILIINIFNSEKTKEEVPKHDSDSELVVKAINSTTYSLGFFAGTRADILKNAVNCAGFIKNRLPENIKKIFKDSFFSLNKIINEKGIEISDEDFQIPGTIVCAKINYNYAEFKNQITTFKIFVESNSGLVVKAINNTTFDCGISAGKKSK